MKNGAGLGLLIFQSDVTAGDSIQFIGGMQAQKIQDRFPFEDVASTYISSPVIRKLISLHSPDENGR